MGAGTQSLGQVLFVGLEETRWTASCERVIRRFQPGGVLLIERNLRTPERTAEMLRKITGALDVPPFLALEQEGGTVDPLRTFFPPLPSPRIAAVKGPHVVEQLGSLIGEASALLGFNLNFAPRLDLANPFVKPSLQPQSFRSDPRTVARCGEAFVTGLRRHKVLACGKHFPGLSTEEYADGSSLPVVDKPMRTLWREDLLPFRQLLPRLALVKLSYVAYKAYDFDLALPAACSANILNGLLRVKLGYGGVAVADHTAPVMEAVRASRSEEVDFALPVKTYVVSLMAGCDMQIIRFWGRRSLQLGAESLKHAFEDGTLTAQRVDEALKRIERAKRGIRLPTGKFSNRAFDRLCRKFEEFARDVQFMEREIA